jgi:hypothetical protein
VSLPDCLDETSELGAEDVGNGAVADGLDGNAVRPIRLAAIAPSMRA